MPGTIGHSSYLRHWEERDGRIPGASWPATLDNYVLPSQKENLSLKSKKWQFLSNGAQSCPLFSMQRCTCTCLTMHMNTFQKKEEEEEEQEIEEEEEDEEGGSGDDVGGEYKQ